MCAWSVNKGAGARLRFLFLHPYMNTWHHAVCAGSLCVCACVRVQITCLLAHCTPQLVGMLIFFSSQCGDRESVVVTLQPNNKAMMHILSCRPGRSIYFKCFKWKNVFLNILINASRDTKHMVSENKNIIVCLKAFLIFMQLNLISICRLFHLS